jgi:hypothetical protein
MHDIESMTQLKTRTHGLIDDMNKQLVTLRAKLSSNPATSDAAFTTSKTNIDSIEKQLRTQREHISELQTKSRTNLEKLRNLDASSSPHIANAIEATAQEGRMAESLLRDIDTVLLESTMLLKRAVIHKQTVLEDQNHSQMSASPAESSLALELLESVSLAGSHDRFAGPALKSGKTHQNITLFEKIKVGIDQNNGIGSDTTSVTMPSFWNSIAKGINPEGGEYFTTQHV